MSVDLSIRVRVAARGDTDAIVSIVNEAYRVEAFFVEGNRTSAAEVSELIDREEILVATGERAVVGCVHVSAEGGRGYFGMLAVTPTAQGRGIGLRLIREAEGRARTAGCQFMDIKVVDVRTDLVAFYPRLGYRPVATEPYVHRPVLQPVHFIAMEKTL